MKMNILKITGACILLIGLISNLNLSKTNNIKNELLLSNVLAISQAQAGEGGSSSGYRCWSEWNGCWFFGCTHITVCGQPCYEKTADSWSGENTCQ